ncbi:hypothetical protein D7Z54_25105 [Salibacterium salarium]|uniref:Phage capsid protein n=1 Tax=Salibacterium salarium TaxID=284579 RepID=A0A428MWZ0_9BACI|nr:DUF6366 family protein [Salibacterium salarium]RSL30641.1 hypothetical protein D7Z54_25105 [Salibacterium salarium]
MSANKETPKRRRERLRQGELRKNPSGNMNDASHKANSSGLVDLVNSLGWKGMGILIVVIIVGYIIASLFFG